jgi:hypothetical protein
MRAEGGSIEQVQRGSSGASGYRTITATGEEGEPHRKLPASQPLSISAKGWKAEALRC